MEILTFLSGIFIGALIAVIFRAGADKFNTAQGQFDKATAARKSRIDNGHTMVNSRWAGINSMFHGGMLYGLSMGMILGITYLAINGVG